MDNQDQRRTHTQGHESHGVHVCHKCGWPFPNPHPSAKHRRAHKKICGTIEGYKLLVSESQPHSNASDDEHEHLSDDDRNTQGPNALDIGNSEKSSGGTRENLIRSGDEVFLDAIANFSDGGLRDSLDSGYSGDNDSNAPDVSQLIVKSIDDGQMQDPNTLQSGRIEDGNMLELQGQLSDSPVDALSSCITDLRTKELTVVHSDDCFSLSSDSSPSKAEAAPAELLEDKIYSGENVRGYSLTSVTKEQNNCELVNEEMHAEESFEVSSIKFMVESDKRLIETGVSMNAVKTEMNENHIIHFSEEQESDDVPTNSQKISLPEGSFMAASKENLTDASFGGSTISVTSTDNVSHQEKNLKEINAVAVDDKCRGANVENDIGISIRSPQPNNLHLEVKPSSGVYKGDEAVEMGKIEKCDITDGQYMERPIVKDTSLPKSASSDFECPILPEVVMDRSARTQKNIECTNRGPLLGAQEDIKDDEINSDGRGNEDCNRFVGFSVDSHQAQDEELLMKTVEDLGRNYSSHSSLNIEPVQAQSNNNEVKPASSAIDTKLDSGSRGDSLEGNWGSVSVSVISVQSDVVQAVVGAGGLASTDLLASTESGKSNLKDPKAASQRQQYEKPEMFEPPSFMTWVEPGHVVGPNAATSEVQKEPNQQHPTSTTLQAGWFPTITQAFNESLGRKRNEETIAKITKRRTDKQEKPLKTLLSEAAQNNKPKSPKLEESSVNQKNSEVREVNGFGLTSVNSIVGPESPATKAVKGKGGKEWNSPSRHPAGIKKQNKKVKSKPYWIQFVCCSSVDSQRS